MLPPSPPLFLQSDKRGRGGAALAPTPRPDSIWRHYSNLPASLFESEGGREEEEEEHRFAL